MDFLPGGDIFHHLNQRNQLNEDQIKFYFAEILAALGHLHQNGIIHRDLKSENILLDIDGNISKGFLAPLTEIILKGHVKIVDFGLS